MGKIRVAFFADILKENFDGVSNTLHQIIKRIPNDRIDPLFITPHPPEDRDFPHKVVLCPFIPFPLYDDYRLALPWKMKIKEILDDFKPDIIHWTSPSLLGEYAIRYGRKNGIRVSTIYHTHFPTYLEYYVRWLPKANKTLEPIMRLFYSMYKRSDLILVPTHGMVSFLQGKNVDLSCMKVWGRGVDSRVFNPSKRSSVFRETITNEQAKLILFVSRLVKEKETKTLVNFFHLVKGLGQGYELIVVGDGPERKDLELQMKGAHFLGRKGREELAVIYASSDVFVFPSVTETFGNVILESFASGLPVIAANTGGPADIIQNGITGLLVEPKDAGDMLLKVKQLFDQPKMKSAIVQNARKYAESQNWDDLCIELFSHYQELGD